MPSETLGFHHLSIHTAIDLLTTFTLLGYDNGDAQPFEGSDLDAFEFTEAESASIARLYIVGRRDLHTVYLFELRDLRGAPLRNIAWNLSQRGSCLLILTHDYREIVFVDPRFAGSSTKSNLRLSKLKLITAEPTRHDLDTLNAIHAHKRTGTEIYDAQRDAFSVSALTTKFDREYTGFFQRVCTAAKKYNLGVREFQDADKTDKLRAFAQRLLGRLMFLYFLQRKGWLNGRQKFITEQYRACIARHRDDDGPKDRETFYFYSEVLSPLFFETMNTPTDQRKLPAWAQWNAIPYLNGGLFDPQRDPAGTILLPDALFDPLNNEGVLAFLNRYNFTISEDTPLEQDVAVDPEMLGKVFENQLEEQDRGQSGSFYTPRVIVAYMCQEALAGYLEESAAIPRERTRALFDPDSAERLTSDEAVLVGKALDTLTVLDPAVGSGSFLIGMMSEILRLRRVCATAQDQPITPALIAEWKEQIIRDTLYGVDIKPEAIEVAQLRLWLALVVDQPLDQARPLPNLEYKLMAGDSLIETLDGQPILTADSETLIDGTPSPHADVQLNFIGEPVQHKMALFESEQVERRERKRLDDLRRAFFRATPEERRDLREQISEQERTIVYAALHTQTEAAMQQVEQLGKKSALQNGVLKQADKRKLETASAKLTRLQALEDRIRDLRQALPFFLYHLYFHEVFTAKGGFDVVVANPPYVRQEMIRELKPELEQSYPEVYAGTADLYVYFYARGLRLVRPNGRLIYITPNKFMRAAYGAKLRNHLRQTTTLETLIDFGDLPLFDVTTYPMITAIRKISPTPDHAIRALTIADLEQAEHLMNTASHAALLPQNTLSKSEWQLSDPAVRALMEKLRAAGKPLGEYVQGKFYRGITSGLNEAFVIDEAKRTELITADPKNAEIIQPYLRGRDIKKWYVDSPGLYFLYISWNCPIENYPAIFKHLQQHQKKLASRPEVIAGRFPWYALSRYGSEYVDEFEKPKILAARFMATPLFGWDNNKSFTNDACYLILGDLVTFAILNSQAGWYFLTSIATLMQNKYYQIHIQYLEKIPIPDAPQPLRDQIASLAEQCLAAVGDAAKLAKLETQLNALVYQAYGLTDAEIALIEGSVGGFGAAVATDSPDENE